VAHKVTAAEMKEEEKALAQEARETKARGKVKAKGSADGEEEG